MADILRCRQYVPGADRSAPGLKDSGACMGFVALVVVAAAILTNHARDANRPKDLSSPNGKNIYISEVYRISIFKDILHL